jgi:hypothetical protein
MAKPSRTGPPNWSVCSVAVMVRDGPPSVRAAYRLLLKGGSCSADGAAQADDGSVGCGLPAIRLVSTSARACNGRNGPVTAGNDDVHRGLSMLCVESRDTAGQVLRVRRGLNPSACARRCPRCSCAVLERAADRTEIRSQVGKLAATPAHVLHATVPGPKVQDAHTAIN